MSLGVIIPAAGQGVRMKAGISKQYLQLANRPILAHTIELFFKHPAVDQLLVVVRKEEMEFCQKEIIDRYFHGAVNLVAGGKTRRQSVLAGLKAFSPAINYVLIHDGVRPLLPEGLIPRVIEAVKEYKAVTLGIKPKDTIKVVDADGVVVETPERSKLASIQTPQAFSYELILRAHQMIGEDVRVTDDSSLVEELGERVRVIPGSDENLKITTPLDLVIAEKIIQQRVVDWRKG